MPNPPPRTFAVVAICFAAIVFDGYDLIIYGSTVPALLGYTEWSLTPADAGAIASYALLGMFFGAISAGSLTERFGRRRVFVGCLTLYSLAMIPVALAPTPELLGIARFVAGLGFGGVAPVAIALVVDVAPESRRNRLNAIMLAGLPVGGVVAAILSILLLDDVGFRPLWGFGAIALITVVPLAWRYIPETRMATTRAPARDAITQLFRSRRSIATLALFAMANFAGFLLVFGLNTWLPKLMQEAGYGLESALAFQLLLNAGAIAGGLYGSTLADRYGSRGIAAGAFAVATTAALLMAASPPTAALVLITIAAGAGSIGTQIILFGYVATHYEGDVRATALGITTGIGRLGAVCGPVVGGLLLSSSLSFSWTFGFFGLIAVLGGVACLSVPRDRSKRFATIPVPT